MKTSLNVNNVIKLDSDGMWDEKGGALGMGESTDCGRFACFRQDVPFWRVGSVTSSRERMAGSIEGHRCPSQREANVERWKPSLAAGEMSPGLRSQLQR